MKIKELIKELVHYNPDMDVMVMYPEKENNEFISIQKCGLFKGVHTCFYLELLHDKDEYYTIKTSNEIDE